MEIDTPEHVSPDELNAAPVPALPWPGYVAHDGDAPRDCPHCPRLVKFRTDLRARHIGWWNAPVPGFGDPDAWLAVVGLAPGMRGANRTGRPFTGDQAGVFYCCRNYGTYDRYFGSNPCRFEGKIYARNDSRRLILVKNEKLKVKNVCAAYFSKKLLTFALRKHFIDKKN